MSTPRSSLRKWSCAPAVILVVGVLVAGCSKQPAPPTTAASDPPRPASAPAPPLAITNELDLVPSDAALFATVRLGEVWNSEALKPFRGLIQLQAGNQLQEYEKLFGVAVADVERVSGVVLNVDDTAPGWVVIATAAKPFDWSSVFSNLAPGASHRKHNGHTYFVTASPAQGAIFRINDRALMIGKQESVLQLLDRAGKPTTIGPLTEALKLARGKHAAVVGFDFTPIRKHVPANMPLEAQRFLPLLAMSHGAVTVDLHEGLQMVARLSFPGENQARAGESAVRDGLEMARQALGSTFKDALGGVKPNPQAEKAAQQIDAWLAGVPVQVQGSTLVVSPRLTIAEAAVAVGLLLPAVQKVRVAANRMVSQNKLKMIGQAMHAYHEAHGHLPPPAIYSKDGKPLLSWRVALLPYLEMNTLYKLFRFDEPWDSPHNRAVSMLSEIPVYRHPGVTLAPELASYRMLMGHEAGNVEGRRMRFADITDGTANTIAIVETTEAVPWTKPDELLYDAQKPLPKLGGIDREGFNALFFDGSVHFVRRDVSEKVLRALITRGGGEVIDSKDYRR